MSSGRRAYDILRSYVNREWDRLRDLDEIRARNELDAPTIPSSPQAPAEPAAPAIPETPQSVARKVLGVEPSAGLDEIQRAYERLCKRAEPSRFAEGSDERKIAEQLRERIDQAFRVLKEDLDPTEKRFRSLEID
ncbi:MAG TPA: J domain-containing protein [Fimbriimonadaceae bacterium]|nr:J domain-containing protein [Fimbriimonadaceae bacterium]HRJ33416.1 J domain-containing protein [Fimbriimonadaceae bacterium]